MVDTAEHIKLHNASVSILSAKDSILQSFVRVADNGAYSFNNLIKGKFILLISYPGYADYVENFTLDSLHATHDFGQIIMFQKAKLLADVIIRGKKAAIKIKGDTTEFNASSYTVQANAKVEDLLKQLPGIQIDKDGKITAQGQAVNKVLVDGEEFFGDDPTLVTKNIRADMVDKVQLYDKKSDQATFTGIDDGQKDKTINIKLKEDSKKGIFGKEEVGGGTAGYYQSQLIFNAFKAKQKFSIYSTIGNNSKVGLGWEDNQKYGSGNSLDFGNDGFISITLDGNNDDLDSFDGRYNGQGIPLARTGGVHYDTKWNNEKESINTNYKIGTLNIDGTSDNLIQNNLPGSILNSSSNQAYHKYMFRQKLDAVYQIKLDTSSNLKLSIDGTQKHSTTNEAFIGSELRNDTLINNNSRNLTNAVDQKALNASAFYTHKFHKTGRTFSFNISEAYSESDANGFLKSTINFYNNVGVRDSSQIIDQNKTNQLQSSALKTNLTWSEPFSKSFAIVINYGFDIDNNKADRKSFNPSTFGNYNILVDSLSSNYKLNQYSNQFGAIFNFKKGKTNLNFGTKLIGVNFNEINEYTGLSTDRNFLNWAPQASFQYRFSQRKSFRISYNGNTTQPTLDEIQPIKVNNDPLNVIVGNPNLKPSFSNRFNINYNSYKVISDQFIGFYGGYTFTVNPIVNNVTTDPVSGKSISKYLNLPGKETNNFYFGGDANRKIEALGLNVGLGINANGNTYYNYVNDELNETKSYSYNPRFSINKYKEKKYDFGLSGGPTFSISQSSLQTQINNNGRGFQADLNGSIYLPGKLQIGTYSNYQYNGKTASFNNDFSRVLINAFLIKSFLKSESLKLELWGNDLLNQNVGFNRSATSNTITQTNYTSIKRYFMLTISYDFTQMGGATKK